MNVNERERVPYPNVLLVPFAELVKNNTRKQCWTNENMLSRLGKIVIHCRVLFVSFNILPLDKAFNPLLDVWGLSRETHLRKDFSH